MKRLTQKMDKNMTKSLSHLDKSTMKKTLRIMKEMIANFKIYSS